jgi:hypothetical protein
MKADELLKAKCNAQPVQAGGEVGRVNGVGNTHTYVYFPKRQRITMFGNDEIELHNPTTVAP